MQWQPDGSTIHTKKWFLGAGFLEALQIFLNNNDTTIHNTNDTNDTTAVINFSQGLGQRVRAAHEARGDPPRVGHRTGRGGEGSPRV